MDNWLNDIPPLRKPRQKKSKPVKIVHKYDVKKLYQQAHEQNFKRETPEAYNSGHYFKPDMPDITTTNGFTRYIVNVINFAGHHAERINTGGTQMFRNGKPVLDDKGKPKYRRSGSMNGSPDIHCEIKIPSQQLPVGWKIEVKNKDYILHHQDAYRDKMKRIGVLHSIFRVGDLDLFWDEFYCILKM